MKITGDWLEQDGTQALCVVLEAGGHRAFLVGGCVRNALFGVPVSDIDIATDALPESVTDLARAAGFKVIATGIEHGTVTVIAGGKPHEVTTFRRDVATDGRHAVVSFTDDLLLDAGRRDFTMNALYADRFGVVFDPLGGLPDVMAHHVRFVGDPAQRIREDYLRILRFFRFYAQHGDPSEGLDADGLAACAALAEGVEGLSRERIGAEMRKLLSAANPAPAVAAMGQSGVLGRVLPGADPVVLAPLVHLEGDLPPQWLRRLAALGGDAVAARLRLSRAEARDLAALRDAAGSTHRPAALGWLLKELGEDAVLVRAALLEQPLPHDWQNEVLRGRSARFPVEADDLMPALAGPALGAQLKELEQRWLIGGLHATREDLLENGLRRG
jgi:poly(A) polymerase